MLQVRIHGPNDVRIDDVERPSCGPDDVLLEVTRCGVCGTDLFYVAQGGVAGPTGTPMALGHEICGHVIEVGEAVEGITPGMRVAVHPVAASNFVGNGGPEGGFAEVLLVRHARLGDTVHVLPDSLDDDMGAFVEPFAVALHAVSVSAAVPGEPVVVIGAGMIGLGIVAALRARGVDDVVVLDLSRERLARAERVGARATVDMSRDDFFGAVGALHGIHQVFGQPVVGSRVFFDAAGAPRPVETAIRHAPFGARLVIAGMHRRGVLLDLRLVLAREIRIQGTMGPVDEFPAAIESLASGRVDAASLISHRFELRAFADALRMAGNPREAGKVMITIGDA